MNGAADTSSHTTAAPERHAMFISKYGKTYDSADGSEQSFDAAGRAGNAGWQRGGEIGRERWADDGGPANDLPAPALAARPAWSVLSLHDLNEKIRDELRVDNPVRWQLHLAREERHAAHAQQRAADNVTPAALTIPDR